MLPRGDELRGSAFDGPGASVPAVTTRPTWRLLLHRDWLHRTEFASVSRFGGSAPADLQLFLGLGAEPAKVLVRLLGLLQPLHGPVVPGARLVLVAQAPVRHGQEKPFDGVHSLGELRGLRQ